MTIYIKEFFIIKILKIFSNINMLNNSCFTFTYVTSTGQTDVVFFTVNNFQIIKLLPVIVIKLFMSRYRIQMYIVHNIAYNWPKCTSSEDIYYTYCLPNFFRILMKGISSVFIQILKQSSNLGFGITGLRFLTFWLWLCPNWFLLDVGCRTCVNFVDY